MLTITWSLPTAAGVYTTTVTGSITNAAGTRVAETSFVLTVTSCAASTDTISITASIVAPVTM